MKKLSAFCLLSLAFAMPALAACGDAAQYPEENAPAVFAPAPPVSDPSLQIPDPIPPFSEENPEDPAPERLQYIEVRADGLNVRSGAGTAFSPLGQAEKGALLPLCGEENGWYRTYYRNRPAFVSANAQYTALTTAEAGEERAEAVIAEGMKLLGTPYVYGAVRFHDGNGNLSQDFSENAFDCSSLMQYIFYRGAGILLDVTTRTQVRQGVHVERDALRRGDLLFFTNAARQNKTGVERVGHVALYLGENYILHTASDFAKAEKISEKRWSYFLEARRVL